MKRGLIEWDRQELPATALEERCQRLRRGLARSGMDGLLLYADVWRSGQVRYLTNLTLYWNQALLLFPQAGELTLLCTLSPRVYPWIRETTILQAIEPAADLGQEAARKIKAWGWRSVGVVELGNLPVAVSQGLQQGLAEGWAGGALLDGTPLMAERGGGLDPFERAMRRRAGEVVAGAYDGLVSTVAGKRERQAAAALDRALRRAGAEDLTILLSPGHSGRWPSYPGSDLMGGVTLWMIAAEYKGHWVEVARTSFQEGGEGIDPLCRDGLACYRRVSEELSPPLNGARLAERLLHLQRQHPAVAELDYWMWRCDTSYPFVPLTDLAQLQPGGIFVFHLTAVDQRQQRFLWGDTFCLTATGVESLTGRT